jgi:hypothetical protein
MGVNLDVATVHDENKHGQRLPGHLWERIHVTT